MWKVTDDKEVVGAALWWDSLGGVKVRSHGRMADVTYAYGFLVFKLEYRGFKNFIWVLNTP